MIKRLLTLAAAVAAISFGASADTLPLPLDNLGSGWESSYDAASKTITFNGAWKGRGWWLEANGVCADYTAYDEVVVKFKPAAFDVKLVVEYGEAGATSSDAIVAAGSTEVVVALDAAYKNAVQQIYIQNSAAGTLTLTDAYLQNAAVVDTNTLPLPLDNLGSGWESSYDAASKTITFNGAWKGRGWWLEANGVCADYTAYDEVVVKFKPAAFDVKLVVEYGEAGATSSDAIVAAGSTEVVVALDAAYKNAVQQIYIQNSAAGTLTLTEAYLRSAAEVDPTGPVVLWEGNFALGWDQSSVVSLEQSDLTKAKVAAGDKIVFDYTAEGNNGFKMIYVDPAYTWTIMPFIAAQDNYNTEYQTIYVDETKTSAEFVLGEADAAIFNDATFHGAKIQGDKVTLKKVSILHKGSNGIADITVDENAPVEFYNLQGVRVANPENGLYIRRQGNKATKVFVK